MVRPFWNHGAKYAVQNYRNLLVWQKAHELSVSVYKAMRQVARIDKSGVASQSQRAAQSIPANIAEGCGRSTTKELHKFLHIAVASSCELEDHLQFAKDVDLLPPNEATDLTDRTIEVRKMLYGLIRKLKDERV